MTSSFRLRSASLTHSGLVRVANEDSMLTRDDAGAWAVADGMGGHANGQWASSVVVSAIEAAPLEGGFEAVAASLTAAIRSANTQIFSSASQAGVRMGSTVAALCLREGRFACLWVGDSRIYLLRDGRLRRMTRDHTQVQDMVERGLLAPEDAVDHPMSHVLSRAVGARAELALDTIVDQAHPGDIFMLCSDGLSGLVSDEEIAHQLVHAGGEAACRGLLDLVLSRGAPDNVTMIAVVCGGSPA